MELLTQDGRYIRCWKLSKLIVLGFLALLRLTISKYLQNTLGKGRAGISLSPKNLDRQFFRSSLLYLGRRITLP